MRVIVYNSSAENNKLDKTNQLTKLFEYDNVVFKQDTSVINPVITLTLKNIDVSSINYVYIDTFNRYYFVDEITLVSNNLYQITLHVDVLMSFKNDIRRLNAIIGRIGASDRGNFYIPDDNQITEARSYNIMLASSRKFINEPNYILTVAGGN